MMDKAALEAELQALIPPDMTKVYLGLLMRGPAWTPEVTEATERLQIAHLTHIRQMVEAGQVSLVGPCTDGGQLRGAYILRVNSLEEARALADADPAVKAGRLVVELHPWLVSESKLSHKGKAA